MTVSTVHSSRMAYIPPAATEVRRESRSRSPHRPRIHSPNHDTRDQERVYNEWGSGRGSRESGADFLERCVCVHHIFLFSHADIKDSRRLQRANMEVNIWPPSPKAPAR